MREAKTHQRSLFDPLQVDTPYAEQLRFRYHEASKRQVLTLLENSHGTLYDELVAEALSFPMCREADLKTWLHEWATSGRIEVKKPRTA